MKMKKIITLILIAMVLCMTFSACGSSKTGSDSAGSTPASDGTEEQNDKLVAGMLEQNSIETSARKNWTQANGNDVIRKQIEYKRFASLNTMLMELGAGRADFLQLPGSVAAYLAAADDSLIIETKDNSRPNQHYHMAARGDNTALMEELNKAIDALKADGTLDQLVSDYIAKADSEPASNALVKNEGGETHVVAVTGDLPPLDYVAADGTPAGFNVALLNAISEKTGCNFEIVQMDAAARLSALESGKVDLVFWIGCWSNDSFEPEEENISLSTSYFEEPLCFVSYSTDVLEKIRSIFVRAN